MEQVFILAISITLVFFVIYCKSELSGEDEYENNKKSQFYSEYIYENGDKYAGWKFI